MDKIERLIKEYLKNNIDFGNNDRTFGCYDEQILLEYLEGALSKERYQEVEYHIAGCGFCLSQLNIAFQAQLMKKQKNFNPVPQSLMNKTKSLLGIDKGEEHQKNNKIKKIILLVCMIIFFVLSFVIHKYFIQFLVAALILGIRWAFESESGRTLIMVLDSWRRHSHEKDEEISHHFKSRF